MRPTPTADILPTIIAEIQRAGLKKSQITIVIASGSHQIALVADIEKKVGKDLQKEIQVVAHDDQADDLVYVGKTKNGTKVHINNIVARADFKVSIGGLYPHPIAGFSGGAKTLVPGICGLGTIEHIHAALKPANFEGQSKNDFRNEINTIGKMIGIDFIVNVLLTPERKIGELFAGDMIKAHQKGIETAIKCYSMMAVITFSHEDSGH